MHGWLDTAGTKKITQESNVTVTDNKKTAAAIAQSKSLAINSNLVRIILKLLFRVSCSLYCQDNTNTA